MFQRLDRYRSRARRRAIQHAETFERPQRVHRGRIQTQFVELAVSSQREKLWGDIFLSALDQQALGVLAPEQIVVRESRYELGRAVFTQMDRLILRRALVDHAV